MDYRCEVKTQAVQPVLTIRTQTPVGAMPDVLGQAYGTIAQYLAGLGEQMDGPPFVAYYNMDMEDLDIEIGLTLSKRVAGKDTVQAGELPEGKIATCVHIGSYDEIRHANAALSAWMEANGHVPTGVACEFYLNDPSETPPEELVTQVVFPLRTS